MWDGAELEILRAITGPLYARRRDAALASGASFARVLEQASAGPDERLRITAAFLAGWQADRDVYEAFERDLAAIDMSLELRKVTGPGPAIGAVVQASLAAHGERLLPYCWESLVKLGGTLPSWKKMACFEAIVTLPSAASVEPLFWCVDEGTDSDVRSGAYEALVSMLGLVDKARVAEGKRLHTTRLFVYEDLIQRFKIAEKKKA
ncbi:MAG: hypothetical protein R3B70_30840 [Polyangiaceae bacterium]